MHPRHYDDQPGQTSWLTTLTAVLLVLLLVGAVIKFDLWQVPEDQSAAILLPDGTAPQPVATAERRN
jgi:hypothetical protein